MIEYEVRREGSAHRVVVTTIDNSPEAEKTSRELATEAAIALSRAWTCELTIWRVDDMAWHAKDYAVQIGTYSHGEPVTGMSLSPDLIASMRASLARLDEAADSTSNDSEHAAARNCADHLALLLRLAGHPYDPEESPS